MKKKELFEKSIAILVNAYQNDTLVYTNCKACAVGNLVANGMGIKLTKDNQFAKIVHSDNDEYGENWFDPFTLGGCGKHGILTDKITEKVIKEVSSTGYDIFQLAEIERAFCLGVDGMDNQTDYNFNGLMSVCDTLMQIHKCTETEITESKALFVKV